MIFRYKKSLYMLEGPRELLFKLNDLSKEFLSKLLIKLLPIKLIK